MPIKNETLKWLGFPNYLAYSNGNIYSVDKNIFLKPVIVSTGYCKITLYYNGIHKTFSLHRIIYFSFKKENRKFFNDSSYDIHHKNENKKDNRLYNLCMSNRYEHLTKFHYENLLKQQKKITSLAKDSNGFHIKCLTGTNKGKVFKSRADLCKFIKQCPRVLNNFEINQKVRINKIEYKRIK